jgi:DNA-binding MarR family transcriptional regulator
MAASTAAVQPSDTCSCISLRKATRHVSQFYDAYLAPSGIRTTQYSILSRVARQGAPRINTLAAELAMDRSTMSRNLNPLQRMGLVTVAPDPRDARSRRVSLTPEGEATLEAARPLWRTAQAAFDRAFGDDRSSVLRSILAELVATPLRPAA